MGKLANAGLLAVLLATIPARGQLANPRFEGVLEMKLTMTDKDGGSSGGGSIAISLSPAGARSELNMQHGPMAIQMVLLQKASVPGKTFHLNDQARTYSEIDLTRTQPPAGSFGPNLKYTVKKLGQEKILGYKTQHVLVEQESAPGAPAGRTELWTSMEFMDYDTFSKLEGSHGRSAGQSGIAQALKNAKVDGMPLKSVIITGDGGQVTIELVKAEKQSLPAGMFEIPEGYTKATAGFMNMGAVSGPAAEQARKSREDAQQRLDAAEKQMQESLKKMTPEERQAFDEFMRQHAGVATNR